LKQAQSECIKDRAIGTGEQKRPDCIIVIDGLVRKKSGLMQEKKSNEKDTNSRAKTDTNEQASPETSPCRKICLNVGFKYLSDVDKALAEASQDLVPKKGQFPKDSHEIFPIKGCEPIFIAGALGGGVPKSLEFYKLKDGELKLFEEWPKREKLKEELQTNSQGEQEN